MSTRPAKKQPEPTLDQAHERQARIDGYEGELCPHCTARQLVRSGKVFKCDNCSCDGEYIDGRPVLLHVAEWKPVATGQGGEWVATPRDVSVPGQVAAEKLLAMSANEKTKEMASHYVMDGEMHWDRMWRLYGRGYFVGSATKYIERYHLKDGIKDLKKALHFIQKLIELEQAELDKKEKPNA